MKSVLVTGSRTWPSVKILNDTLDFLLDGQKDVTLINGGARGADQMAIDYWETNNVGRVITIPADWNTFGAKAGVLRNIDMVNMDPDLVVAFIYNVSPGASQCLKEARRRGLKNYAIHTTLKIEDNRG